MELLKWGKDNNQITYGILEFITSHKWEELRYLRDNGLNANLAIEILSDD
jgi:hypothetical protein